MLFFSAIIMYIARKGHEVTRKELIENPPFSESTVKSIQEDILSPIGKIKNIWENKDNRLVTDVEQDSCS
jgi:uncharacterized protein YneF (UPF0154 family)